MSRRDIPVAIQLYSVRTAIADDVPGTLKKLAAMGYQGVETAGFYGLDGPALRAMLDDCGLRCAGAHTGLKTLEGDERAATVAVCQALGTDRLIVPSADMDELDNAIARMKQAYDALKPLGMRTGFHNHTREFELVGDTTKFDKIFSDMPDDFLAQLDIGWATCAGQDVPALLRRHAQRLETVHVKEYHPDKPEAVVGEGRVDWATILPVIERETAVQWYVVEQEQYEKDPLDSAQRCVENLRAILAR